MGGLTISDLVVEYSSGGYAVRPIDGLSLDVAPGSLVILLGPSGCGKTTLLSCLGGILRPKSGSIKFDDVDITTLEGAALAKYRRDKVGIVFQAFNLVSSLTALENVMVPLRAAGVSRAAARKRAEDLLIRVNLGERMKCASSSRRPAAKASRCANLRTADSSANRIWLRRNPFPSSTHTESGAVTRTSVVPSADSSGSRMPAPVSSVCSTRRFASTSVSPSIPPDSARIAAATTLGRSGPDSDASRSRTRSIREPVMPPYRVALTQHVAAHQVPVGQPMPAPIAVAVEDPRVPAVRLAAAGPSWMPVAAPRRRPRPLPPAIPPGRAPAPPDPGWG